MKTPTKDQRLGAQTRFLGVAAWDWVWSSIFQKKTSRGLGLGPRFSKWPKAFVLWSYQQATKKGSMNSRTSLRLLSFGSPTNQKGAQLENLRMDQGLNDLGPRIP